MKVLTLVGTRPELIKLSCTILELDKVCDHILVHTGQNYDFELNEVFFKDLGIRKPDVFLEAAGSTPAETIASVIQKVDSVLEEETPNAMLVYGDTNSCLGVIAAKRRQIPIFHMEAGNRCFDLRVPEEINRKIVDHLSDINMVLSEHARRYLVAEGVRPETIIKTGSSMKEILFKYRSEIDNSNILNALRLDSKGYILVSLHREENVDNRDNLMMLITTLLKIREYFGKKIVVSLHPRTRKRLENLGYNLDSDEISFMKPFGFFDYIKLQMESYCVISDSGTITEEASLLGLPAVMVRNAHERPEGMDEGTVIMSGLFHDDVVRSVKYTVSQFVSQERPFAHIPDYDVLNVSSKVVKIILSYTGYINRVVWRKY